MPPHTIPPGWYDDGLGSVRWWDGQAWTDQTYTPVPVAHAAPGADEGFPTAGTPGTTVTATRPVVASAPAAPRGDGVLPLVLGLILLLAAGYSLVTAGLLFGLGLLVGIGLLVRARAEFRGEQPPWGLAGTLLPRGAARLGLVVAGLLVIMFGITAMQFLVDKVAPADVVPPLALAPATAPASWPLHYIIGEGFAYLPGKELAASQCPSASLACRAVSVATATDCSTAVVFAEYRAKTGSASPVRINPSSLRRVSARTPTTVILSAPRGSDVAITRVVCRA